MCKTRIGGRSFIDNRKTKLSSIYGYKLFSHLLGLNAAISKHMNVVPGSTGNTNSGTRELTLKCKLKCYFKPMNNPLGVSPRKGNREPHEAKKKSFDLGGNRTHDLRIRSTVTIYIQTYPTIFFSVFWKSCYNLLHM